MVFLLFTIFKMLKHRKRNTKRRENQKESRLNLAKRIMTFYEKSRNLGRNMVHVVGGIYGLSTTMLETE